ncbi:heme NO-binding domain-containing protein [Paenirhodobacter sp.]|uniref:heme NO-binding domain-containing protein n=1 Tax=Paenirhodobacter sp. TaxID=1965326 RepID=UPI003B3F2E6F
MMYGLVNKSVQYFLSDNYGSAVWRKVAQRAGIGPEGFETMLHYPASVTEDLISAAAEVLGTSPSNVLEDIGAHLVTIELVRRLLRFGGTVYGEFLLSLDELRDRGRMALAELDLPAVCLASESGNRYVFEVRAGMSGWGAVTAGVLRAMADDYGALALIEQLPDDGDGVERVQVMLLEEDFATGKGFALAPSATEGHP